VLNGTEGVANVLVQGQGLATGGCKSTQSELGIGAGPGDGISDPEVASSASTGSGAAKAPSQEGPKQMLSNWKHHLGRAASSTGL
jgi:hypothetical protein